MSCRQFCGLLLVLVLSASAPAWADAVVNSFLNLTQLTISPSSGWLGILPPVTTSVFAQALDSTGGFDQESGSASASAATLFANGSVTAQSGTGALRPMLSFPISFNDFASSEGQALLFGMFEITGTTGSVMTLSASFTGDQPLMTEGTGVSASSETIFALTSPDISSLPLLSFDGPPSIGTHQTLTVPTNMTLAPMSVSLQSDTPYSFFAFTPHCFRISALLGRRGWRVRLNRDTDPRRRERLKEQC
jgi:hypothetical protein